MSRRIIAIALAVLLPLVDGCTFVSKSDEYNGLPGQRGRPVAYYSATNLGINLLFFIPIIGDTSTTAVLREVTKKVQEDGGRTSAWSNPAAPSCGTSSRR